MLSGITILLKVTLFTGNIYIIYCFALQHTVLPPSKNLKLQNSNLDSQDR